MGKTKQFNYLAGRTPQNDFFDETLRFSQNGDSPNLEALHKQGFEHPEAYNLMKSSSFCCCHIKFHSVFVFVAILVSMTLKYILKFKDPEIEFTLGIVGFQHYYLDYNFIKYGICLIQWVNLAGLMIALMGNNRFFAFPIYIFQITIFLVQYAIWMLFIVLAATRTFENSEMYSAAKSQIHRLEFDRLSAMMDNGPAAAAMVVACSVGILSFLNLYAALVIERLIVYLKHRAIYYSEI